MSHLKLFKYAGSKNKYLDIILPLIDTKKHLIEPFLGSAAVSLNVNNKTLAFDYNERLIDLFNGFKIINIEQYVELYNCKDPELIPNDHQSYYSYRNYYNLNYDSLNLPQKAVHQQKLFQCCLNSLARWGPNGFNQSFGSRSHSMLDLCMLKKIIERCQNIDFKQADFFNLGALDNKDTTWFLDPPYYKNPINYKSNFTNLKTKTFIGMIEEFHGNVIYTDTIHEYNAHLLTSWNCIKLDNLWTTSTKPRKDNTSVDNPEYIFCNFEIQKQTTSDLSEFF
jgi:site-specific DNA-adenine methylase